MNDHMDYDDDDHDDHDDTKIGDGQSISLSYYFQLFPCFWL